MIREHRQKDGTRTYGVRIHRGGGRHQWIGTFPTRREAREAEAEALLRRSSRQRPETVREWCGRWLARYEETRKRSTVDRAKVALSAFLDEHGDMPVDIFDRRDAERVARERNWAVPVLVTCFAEAERQGIVERSPFRGLSRRPSRGRRDVEPLSERDVEQLAEAARLELGPTFGAFVTFAAYTGLRAGELFALEWRDVDLGAGRVQVRRTLYRGRVELPKSNRPRLVALPPPAADALAAVPRAGGLVFTAKRGGRLSQPLMAGYWAQTCARFGRKVAIHELRHFCGHHLYVRQDLPARVVATQLGHSSPRLVEELYGHFKVGALDEIDRAYGRTVRPLREIGRTGGAHGSA